MNIHLTTCSGNRNSPIGSPGCSCKFVLKKLTEDYFCGYDDSYTYIFYSSWESYEENGWIFIFEKEGKYYSIEGGYCVMQVYPYKTTWGKDLSGPMSEDEALKLMIEWEEIE